MNQNSSYSGLGPMESSGTSGELIRTVRFQKRIDGKYADTWIPGKLRHA